ncbi:unnamed protein product [Rhodiola kirilowii]
MPDPSTYFNQFPEHEILQMSPLRFLQHQILLLPTTTTSHSLATTRKNCKRYWTKGGTLRNIPVGGASRKITKRSSSSSKRPTTPLNSSPPPPHPPSNCVTANLVQRIANPKFVV